MVHIINNGTYNNDKQIKISQRKSEIKYKIISFVFNIIISIVNAKSRPD